MTPEYAYIRKILVAVLLGVILYMIIQTWLAKRGHSQHPERQQRPLEHSSDIPSSTPRYESHRYCTITTSDPVEADSQTSGRTARRTSSDDVGFLFDGLEDTGLADFINSSGDAELAEFLRSQRYSLIHWVDEPVRTDETDMHH